MKAFDKRGFLLFVLLIVSLYGMAQQQYHFIYIQADNQQPFYVKYSGKNYSSSSIGYLILPKLSDGNVPLQIGFAKNLYPEQNFNLTVAGKDLGFALKNFAEKGWGLFNFQTTDIVMNGNAATSNNNQEAAKTTTNKSNAFGNMLASAINDSTLNQQRVEATDSSAKTKVPSNLISATDTAQATAQSKTVKDSSGAGLNTSSQTYNNPTAVDSLIKQYSNNTDSIAATKKTLDPMKAIVKSAEKTNDSGTDLTFLDNTSKDTIHAFIPLANKPDVATKAATADSAKKEVANPFFNNNNTATNVEKATSLDTSSTVIRTDPTLVNAACNKMFSSSDADKLKRKIISAGKQDEILNAVRKSLHGKCITTDQVKDLGNLFLSDENRYGFYDVAYPFVYDFGNYGQLQNTLIDTYFKNRFKALLH